jgi:hypothetical protein
LRKAFNDYQALACKDSVYLKYSPLLNSVHTSQNLTDFPLEIEPPHLHSTFSEEPNKKSAGWWCNTSAGLKWAFYSRRKFEHVLAEFKSWNSKLKEIGLGCTIDEIMLISKGNPVAISEALVEETQAPEGQNLGLKSLMSLKRLTVQSGQESARFELQNVDLVESTHSHEQPLALVTLRTESGMSYDVLAEYKEYGDLEFGNNMAAVNQLSSLLAASSESDLKILPFRGFVKSDSCNDEENELCTFIFDFPKNTARNAPVSLRKALGSSDFKYALSLAARFNLAERLARTVWCLHAVGWIHKSIRSNNVVFFESLDGDMDFSAPYLVGFEYARLETDATEYTGSDDDWSKNIYRHPARQGSPKTRFSKTHDLYALGLILLEVGLWRALADILSEAVPHKDLRCLAPKEIKKIFQSKAEQELVHCMGVMYSEAVTACLAEQSTGSADCVTTYGGIVQKVGLSGLWEIQRVSDEAHLSERSIANQQHT